MQFTVICPDHNTQVNGVLGLTTGEKPTAPLVEDLPDNLIDETSVLARPTLMWQIDTSAMYCLGGTKDLSSQNEGDCQLRWQVHCFGVEGAWLTYWDGEEH